MFGTLPMLLQGSTKSVRLGGFVNVRILRDQMKREAFAANEQLRQALRYISMNTTLPPRQRAQAQLALTQMHAHTRSTQFKNRCIMAGKGRGVFRDFKMGRYQFRLNATAGNIPGVQKASW
ncbi:mitochondrial 40S ribosomal protein [Peziza echinospora]|nr:mitochondrial 40S ribosomal protein [Peziza echinospora]